MLRNQGHDVMLAENGLQGLQLIRQSKPKLIISDVQMPLMDGFAVLEAVRKDAALATTPFILLTSLQERSHVRRGPAAAGYKTVAYSAMLPCCMPTYSTMTAGTPTSPAKN